MVFQAQKKVMLRIRPRTCGSDRNESCVYYMMIIHLCNGVCVGGGIASMYEL